MDNKKVVLGLSGGIDSAACAIILKEKGYDVTALYFDVVKNSDLESKNRAENLCKTLNIPFHYVDISTRFEKVIIEPFCESYLLGQTPMPCLMCNPYIKWWILKEYADEIDAYYLATGHYAQIIEKDGYFYIKKSKNIVKDQSYMLAGLDQTILKRALFPLEEFSNKDDVRNYVKEHNIEIPEYLKESQDICFVEKDYRDFLKDRNISSKTGHFINENGEIIGNHMGYTNFTIGQRKGLGMGFGKPMYVKKIDPNSGDVVLCEDDGLYQKDIDITIANFAKYGHISNVPDEYNNKEFDVKIRYAAKPAKAVLKKIDQQGNATFYFESDQRAPAAGQYTVFYDGDIVIGCGIIS